MCSSLCSADLVNEILVLIDLVHITNLNIPEAWTILFSVWDQGSAHINTMSCSWSHVSGIIHAYSWHTNELHYYCKQTSAWWLCYLNFTCRFLLLKVWKLVWGLRFFLIVCISSIGQKITSLQSPEWEILWLLLLIIIALWVIHCCSVVKCAENL